MRKLVENIEAGIRRREHINFKSLLTMKTAAFRFCAFVLFISIAALSRAQTANIPPATPFTIVHREANERTWQRTTYTVLPSGQIVSRIQSYKELATGLCYHPPGQSDKWLDSQEAINILPDGTGSATYGPHQAFLPVDIANGTVRLVTPDGLQLQSQPVGLSYDDGASTTIIAELTNSVGELISSNQVLYPNAFSGIDADLLYTYRKSGFEQDVIFRAQPPAPEKFGLDSANTRLQLLTEFFNPPSPTESADPVNSENGLQDTTLAFGNARMAQGKAFLTGAARSRTKLRPNHVYVYKSWVVIDGRNLLVEQLPYQKIVRQLAVLPKSDAFNSSGPRRHKLSSRRLLPPVRPARPTANSVRLARTDYKQAPGVVLDYFIETSDSSETNFVFQGDVTYDVSGALSLYGETIIEGGTVVKLESDGGVNIDQNGSIDCETTPYRPAIFTSPNDNSAGGALGGSPYYQDVGYCIGIWATNICIHDIRFSYALEGIDAESSTNFYNVWNCQFFNVETILNAYDVNLYNDLIGYSSDEAPQINADTNDEFIISGNLTAENVTSDSGYGFLSASSPGVVAALTNCLITSQSVTNDDFGYAPTLLTNNVIYLPSPTVPVYHTIGGGNYYLANDSPYRGIGTTNIDQTLLADLKQKTTWPPLVYSGTNISSLTTIGPVVSRDTNAWPDIGYHYSLLDYAFGGCDLYSNLTIAAGTVVGWFETNGGFDDVRGSPIPYSISLNHGSALSFTGNAKKPCIYARYTVVQEGGNSAWSEYDYDGGGRGAVLFTGGGSPAPLLSADFTKFTSDNWSDGFFADDATNGAGNFFNCEFYDDGIFTYRLTSLNFTNCLFFRLAQIFPTITPNLIYENCTFYDGGMQLERARPGPTWLIENCSFDGSAFTWVDPAETSTNTFINYNAYNTNNLDWTNYSYPDVPFNPTFGQLEVVGPNDLMVTNYNWQSSSFGDFYLPSDSPLIEKGSTYANSLGLYHFTTQTNQAPDGTNIVTIGYHYVATDQYGNPLDSNGDGIPDYLQDPAGNGSGNWDTTTFLNVIISQPPNGSTVP